MHILGIIGDIASTIISVSAVSTLLFTPLRKMVKGWIIDIGQTNELKESIKSTRDIMDTILTQLNDIKKELDTHTESNQSLLRSEITRTYYSNLTNKTLREYEAEALDRNYDAYKDEDGNSFIDRIYKAMKEWKVIL